MALSTATITFDLADWVGDDLDARRTKGWITTNAPDGYVTDTSAGKIRIDDAKVTVNTDGTGSVTVWVPGADANPETWQTTFHFDVPRNGRRDRKVLTMGPFTITASADLATLIEEQVAIPTATASTYAAAADASADAAASSAGAAASSASAAQTARTGAETAQAAAEAARDLAVDISGIDSTDEAVAAGFQIPGSQSGAYLSATIAEQTGPVVNSLVADAIASDSTPALAAAAAVNTALANAEVYRETLYSLGSTRNMIGVDPANGGVQSITLTGPTYIAPAAATPGATLALILTQGPADSGFTAPHAVTWSPKVAWQTPPTLSTTPGSSDVVTLLCVGWGWLAFMSGTGLTVPSGNYIADTFSRTYSETLRYTETGEPWISNNWIVSNNQAVPTVAGVTTRAVVDTGRSQDVLVSVKPTNASQEIRLLARTGSDGATYYRFVYNALSATSCYIQRQNGSGQAVVGAMFSMGAVLGDRVGFSVTAPGGVVTIKVYRNDVEVYSVTDGSPPPALSYAGMIGMTTHAVDDFRVDFL